MNAARFNFGLGLCGSRSAYHNQTTAAWFQVCRTAAVCILLTAALARSQDSQFFFDATGNLFVQTVEAIAPPQIIGQPQNQVVAPGGAASFFVVAADTRALTYTWRFNGVPLGGSATNDALLLQNVGATNEGQYSVVLSNPSGSVTSAPAMLWIDSDGDGMGDSWELTFFGDLNQTATANFDGDGSSNLQEFLDGTNPTNSASVLFQLAVSPDGGTVVRTPDLSSYTNGQAVTLTATASPGYEPFHAWLGDVTSRSNSVTLVMTNNKTVLARFSTITFTWTNAVSGDWDAGTNWTPNLAPGSNDSVVISSASGATVTLNTPANCADFTLSQGTLTGSGTQTVRGNFSWTGGALSGSGRTILETNATLSLNNPFALTLTTRTLENGGTAVWSAGSINMSSGVITNRAGALFHVQTANNMSGSGRFDNAGTFRKSANTGTTTFAGVSLNNSGTVELQTGSLNLSGGGTHSGSFTVSSGATLNLTVGSHTGNASSSLTGAGQFTVSGASANLAGLVNVSGSNTFSGGQATFTGAYICTNNALTISGGIVIFNGTGVIAPAVLNLSNGILDGSNVVTVLNQMNWTGGGMSGSGRTVIPPGVTLNAAPSGFSSLTTRTLENGGTVLWTGTGTFNLSSGVITNRPGALFHVQSAATFGFNGGSPRFDNAGTFRKSVNTGTTTVGVSFTNYGTVDIRSGILAANSVYASTSNALLSCAIGGTNAGTGYGRLQVAGTVTLNGGLSVDLLPGFTPATNDTFTVLTAGTRSGTFTGFSYPSNQVTMQLSNTANSVVVRVTAVAVPPPPPTLLSPVLSGSNVLLTWTAVSNATYRLEFNPDLNPSNWNGVPGDVPGVSNTAAKLDGLTPSNRFYRVRVLP